MSQTHFKNTPAGKDNIWYACNTKNRKYEKDYIDRSADYASNRLQRAGERNSSGHGQ
jgi:hypothetical protein